MATIIGGIGVSHTPTIGFAYDANKQDDPAWSPIFTSFLPVEQWFKEHQPDTLIYIFNDHITSFFFDHYSAFTLGIDDEYKTADEGGGARNLPSVKGNPELAQHIATSLMADEFDMSFFQKKPLDHGFFSPMSVLLERKNGEWPCRIVPLQVGVLQFPIPSAMRCFKLGQALKRAIESYPEDIKVAIVATGGLSHQVHGERSGFNNTKWDNEFLELITNNPKKLATMSIAQYAELGGLEGAEVIMWLVMRGALNEHVTKNHSSYYLPSMAGIATLVLENTPNTVDTTPTNISAHREHMAYQLKGIENLEGTHPFTLEKSLRAYRINDYLHKMVEPAHRELFLADPETSFNKAGLSDEEKDLLRRRDWQGLIHYGAIFFVLEKLGAVLGISNLHLYSNMRGESLEDFMKTRNTQVSYSVTGKGTTR